MAVNIIAKTADLKKSIADMLSAHEAIALGIADHAEKHAVAMDARRERLRHEQAIDEGIKRNNSVL